jgi:Holliday junction DNA helicase RuvA
MIGYIEGKILKKEEDHILIQYFISVEDIGPLKAAKALTVPVREIATAIEAGELNTLTKLKGIGRRTAQKIIASLEGKMGKFALIRPEDRMAEPPVEDFSKQVLDVMIKQLGHKMADARQMIDKAMKRNSSIQTAEELFEEVYRGERMGE